MTVSNSITPTAKMKLSPAKTSLLLRALNWLAELDRQYREASKLQGLPSERLVDMGINR